MGALNASGVQVHARGQHGAGGVWVKAEVMRGEKELGLMRFFRRCVDMEVLLKLSW